MAIPKEAQRFKFLDYETNIGSFNFGLDDSSEILNNEFNKVKEAFGEAKELFDSTKGAVDDIAAEVKGQIQGATDTLNAYSREAKSQLGKLMDYANMPNRLLNDFTSSLTGLGAQATKPLFDLLGKCKKGGKTGYSGRPYDTSISCKGNNISMGGSGSASSCNGAGFSNLLNSLSDGAYNSVFKNTQALMNAIMSLSGYGYGLGLCGVFGALKGSSLLGGLGGLGLNELGKAAGGVMAGLAGAQNVKGWLDMASTSVGLNPILTYPGAVKDMISNFAIPDLIKENQLGSFADEVLGGAELIDENWNLSDARTILEEIPLPTGPDPSINYGRVDFHNLMSAVDEDSQSEDLSDVLSAKLTSNTLKKGMVDAIPDTDMDYFLASSIW